MLLPGKTSTSKTPVRVLASLQDVVKDTEVLSPTIVDGSSNPATNISSGYLAAKRVPMGLVLCEDASGGQYVEANDPGRKDATAPSVTSAENVDTGWDDSVLSFYKDGQLITTETGAGSGGSDTVAEWVSALGSNTEFVKHFKAEAVGSALKITGLEGGADHSIRVESSDNVDAFAEAISASSSGASGYGTSPKYRVLLEDNVILADENGTATAAYGLAASKGKFVAANLTSLTGEARAGLVRQGATFV